jgi:hypothetical protein
MITIKGSDFRGDSDKLIGADTFEALIGVLRKEFQPPLSQDKPPQELVTAILLDARLRAAYTDAQREAAGNPLSPEFTKGKLFAYQHACDMCAEIADAHFPPPKDPPPPSIDNPPSPA